MQLLLQLCAEKWSRCVGDATGRCGGHEMLPKGKRKGFKIFAPETLKITVFSRV